MIIVLFDTETDGLISNSLMDRGKHPRIIELYANKIDINPTTFDWVWTDDAFSALFNIGRKLPDIITKITGIKDSDLVGKPTFLEPYKDLKLYVESADRIVAHNLTYDMDMVNAECDRFNLPLIEWPEKICTVEATEHMKGYRLRLGELYNDLTGKEIVGAHRAKVDVEALTECYIELVKRGEL